MDIYSSVCTSIHLIHVTFVFIKGIIEDVKEYDSDVCALRSDLHHEIGFFEQFKDHFLQPGHGKDFFDKQPLYMQEDCKSTLESMDKILAKYREDAQRHGLDLSLQHISNVSGSSSPPPSILDDEQRTQFLQKLAQKMSDLKKKGIRWSMFDKKKLEKMTKEVRKTMKRLRETVGWMAMLKTINSSVIHDQFLEETFKRQGAAESEPDPTFGPLPGSVDVQALRKTKFGITTYVEGSITKQLVYDIREYGIHKQSAIRLNGDDQMLEAKKSLRLLAWWLSQSRFLNGIHTSDALSGVGPTLGLEFWGYLDCPTEDCAVLLYEIPQNIQQSGPSIITLYDLINQPVHSALRGSKPSLGNRFYIAYAIAVTVLNIHSSSWVHKNIRSSSFVMTSYRNAKFPSRSNRTVPYITNWGIARPADGPTNLFGDSDPIANIYRHPDRKGAPTTRFRRIHDVYSIGVVLAEIGLWMTVDKIFDEELKRHSRIPIAPRHFREWWKTSGRHQVSQSMGEAYVEVIEKCIFEKLQAKEEGLIEFRNQVVNALVKAIDL